MRRRYLALLLFLCLPLLYACPRAVAEDARPELRAFWADGFNEGFKTPQQVDELLQRLRDAHCNAVFAQMRKGGDAYYRSHYEPWAKDDTAHFDALAYLIQQAHTQNPSIAVHAWINTCAVGGNTTVPFNILNLHPEWLSLDPQNHDFDNEARKIDPGNPDAADWTFRVYLDVARHYDVDGIHFDFVRYGGPDWGYNPVSVARFRQRFGAKKNIKRLAQTDLPAPDDETWKQWRRDQVTALVRKVYAHAVQINPKLVVSAAVITWGDGPKTEEEWFTKSAAMNRVFQDWRGWLQEGILDLACPMTYFQAGKYTNYQRHWSEFVKNHQYHRAATVAVGNWMNTLPQTLSLLEIARQKSAMGRWPYGVMLYSYCGTNISATKGDDGKQAELKLQPDFYAALSQPSRYTTAPPFPTPAAIPPMRWKAAPKHGHLKGFVLTPKLDAVDGATVRIEGYGKTTTRYTDGTGFYAAIDLPPGKYSVRVQASGYAPHKAQATITAGHVTTTHFTLGGATFPLIRSLLALQGMSNGTPARLENLTVTLGSDTFPGNLYVMDSHKVGMRVHLAAPNSLAFQPGDVVAVTGTLATLDGEPTIDRATARLTDFAPLNTLPAPVATTGQNLTDGKTPNGVPARVQGRVTESNPDGFTVDDGAEVRVVLTGLKDFGVEATAFSLTPPPVGTNVSVTGIVSVTTAEAGHQATVRLRPRAPEDMTVLPPTTASLTPWIVGAMLPCFVSAFAVVTYRHRRQNKRPI